MNNTLYPSGNSGSYTSHSSTLAIAIQNAEYEKLQRKLARRAARKAALKSFFEGSREVKPLDL